MAGRGNTKLLQVTGEIYFPVKDTYHEIASFTSIESQNLLLRDTETYKVTELIADKISVFYKIDSKFQYEIVTPKKTKVLYWGIALIIIAWIAAFGYMVMSNRK